MPATDQEVSRAMSVPFSSAHPGATAIQVGTRAVAVAPTFRVRVGHGGTVETRRYMTALSLAIDEAEASGLGEIETVDEFGDVVGSQAIGRVPR